MTEVPALIHYSPSRLKQPKAVPQPTEPFFKPRGLWLSVEDGEGWWEWCDGEAWGTDRFGHEAVITLADDANVLRLCSPTDIYRFTEEYLRQPDWRPQYALTHYIDWRAVAEKHDGIIIAPYQFVCRLNDRCGWYYAWDCSSGCIWEPRAIASIERRKSDRIPGQNREDAA